MRFFDFAQNDNVGDADDSVRIEITGDPSTSFGMTRLFDVVGDI